MTTSNGLHRSSRNSVIMGVAGGLAEFFDLDPVLMRVIFVLIVLVTGGTAILLYFLMALVLPKGDASSYGQGPANGDWDDEDGGRRFGSRSAILAAALIVIGIAALLVNLNLFWWLTWGMLWPVALIVIGLAFVYRSVRRS